jgi:hypothetical protein
MYKGISMSYPANKGMVAGSAVDVFLAYQELLCHRQLAIRTHAADWLRRVAVAAAVVAAAVAAAAAVIG